jgi:hypothetical protein
MIWFTIISLAAIRSIYSSAVEGLVTWGLLSLFMPDVNFLSCCAVWYVIGFGISTYRLWKIFR